MKKSLFWIVPSLLLIFAVSLFAAEKLEDLKASKKKVTMEMYKLRVKLLQDDPDIKQLNTKIINMQKELAAKIESKEEMKELVKKSKSIDAEINKLSSDK